MYDEKIQQLLQTEGTRVSIRRDSLFADQSKSIGTVGRPRDSGWYTVLFDDGYSNYYRCGYDGAWDLDLALEASEPISEIRPPDLSADEQVDRHPLALSADVLMEQHRGALKEGIYQRQQQIACIEEQILELRVQLRKTGE